MKTTVSKIDGTYSRLSLPDSHWRGHVQTSAGVYLEALYRTADGVYVAEYDSAWGRPDGSREGTKYVELSESDYLHACLQARCEPEGL